MKTYARIESGTVVELLETDGDISTMFHHSLVWVECDAYVQVGYLYDGESFTAPQEVLIPTPVPASVTKRQARAALIIRGHEIGRDYIAEIESYLDSMGGVEGLLARDEWHSSSAVERNRPLTIQMAQLLGLTEEQTDDLFIFAATL